MVEKLILEEGHSSLPPTDPPRGTACRGMRCGSKLDVAPLQVQEMHLDGRNRDIKRNGQWRTGHECRWKGIPDGAAARREISQDDTIAQSGTDSTTGELFA